MNNILVVCLKKLGDVFSTAHLINSIKKENPMAEISLLIYKESYKAAEVIRSVSNIYTIDRKKVLSLKASPLFSDAHSLNEFFSTVEKVSEQKWENIVNFSNDPVATYLTSYLKDKNHSGVAFSSDKSTQYTNYWAKVYNDVATQKKIPIFNYLELQHRMANTPWISTSQPKVQTREENNKTVSARFSELRKSTRGDLKVVGIQIMSADSSKDIPEDKLADLINYLTSNSQFYPVLLLAPSEKEKAYAAKIIEKTSEDLISIETDFKALPSVLLYLDALITPDTSVKHVADLVDTPLVEISCGSSPLFKQSTTNEDNIIIRPYMGKNEYLAVPDIAFALHQVLGLESEIKPSKNSCFYIVKKDETRLEYLPIAGNISEFEEMQRMLARELIFAIDSEDYDLSLIKSFFSSQAVQKFVNMQKAESLEILKNLLSCLRSINTFKQNRSNPTNFLTDLEKLLAFANFDGITNMLVQLFRANIESLSSQNLTSNVAEVENELFLLKKNIKLLSTMLDSLNPERKTIRRPDIQV